MVRTENIHPCPGGGGGGGGGGGETGGTGGCDRHQAEEGSDWPRPTSCYRRFLGNGLLSGLPPG